jgi:hypothetical protein
MYTWSMFSTTFNHPHILTIAGPRTPLCGILFTRVDYFF